MALIFFIFSFLAFSQEDSELLRGKMSELRKTYQLPSITGLMANHETILRHEAVGLRHLEQIKNLVKKDDRFHLGSNGKAMTAFLTALMIQKGLFSWDTPLAHLFRFTLHPSFQNLTIKDLLTHHAGLVANPTNEERLNLFHLSPLSARAILSKDYLTKAPSKTPGSFLYSNIGYMIVGHILESISERTFEGLMNAYVFIPLEMKSCGFGITSPKEETYATQPWGHLRVDSTMTPGQFDNLPLYSPAGTIHCSLPDWYKFVSLHLKALKGNYYLLSKNDYQELHAPYLDSNYTVGGWNFITQNNGNRVFYHNGSNRRNNSIAFIFPDTNKIILSVTNIGDDASDVCNDFDDPKCSLASDGVYELARLLLSFNR